MRHSTTIKANPRLKERTCQIIVCYMVLKALIVSTEMILEAMQCQKVRMHKWLILMPERKLEVLQLGQRRRVQINANQITCLKVWIIWPHLITSLVFLNWTTWTIKSFQQVNQVSHSSTTSPHRIKWASKIQIMLIWCSRNIQTKTWMIMRLM